jgi:phosphoenolpyruvate---glycerone phosphotransferase subunit DhaL
VSTALRDAERIVRTIAETARDNEHYFSELDAAAGDGDFGYSLASGFNKLLDQWDELKYDDPGGLLKATAVVLSSRVGGVSGPIWGTAFLRAGASLSGNAEPSGADVVAALRAAAAGIQQRGSAELGDKTLLDALVPATDALESALSDGASRNDAVAAAAKEARTCAENTLGMLARRGRASYTGERSRESVDAGAIAVATMLENISAALNDSAD